jgi:hypothetical protein
LQNQKYYISQELELPVWNGLTGHGLLPNYTKALLRSILNAKHVDTPADEKMVPLKQIWSMEIHLQTKESYEEFNKTRHCLKYLKYRINYTFFTYISQYNQHWNSRYYELKLTKIVTIVTYINKKFLKHNITITTWQNWQNYMSTHNFMWMQGTSKILFCIMVNTTHALWHNNIWTIHMQNSNCKGLRNQSMSSLEINLWLQISVTAQKQRRKC